MTHRAQNMDHCKISSQQIKNNPKGDRKREARYFYDIQKQMTTSDKEPKSKI